MLRRVLLLATASMLVAWAASAAGASAATCTGAPHNASDHSEFDVKCDTAINNGSFTIRINRGADNLSRNPQVAGGTGALTCQRVDQAPGSGFDVAITCGGSLSANATAKVTAQLGPNACSSPAFKGDLAASFGDGSSFGPAPLAAYPCGGGGGGGGGTTSCDRVIVGRKCDPGGVFGSFVKRLPAQATVAAARSGLILKQKFGVKGVATVTVEKSGKVLGRSGKLLFSGRTTTLFARITRASANALAHKVSFVLVHVEIKPNASEGFTTHGREYFHVKLTG